MRLLLRGAFSEPNFSFESDTTGTAAKRLLGEDTADIPQDWTPETGKLIQIVWTDSKLRDFYWRHDEKKFTLNDTAHYFFGEIERINSPNFCPSVKDVLHVRIRSTGIQEAAFKFGEATFKVVDVGGQRSERRKWIHCFQCVTCVIFCASLSDYDQSLREEKTVNRLEEAIELFDDVYNSNVFADSAVILFLNKIDLFKEKIKRVPLTTLFPAYQGGDDFEKAKQFIEARFIETAHNGAKVYVYATCAIDTESIKIVIQAVKRQILNNFTTQFVL